MKVRNGFVSNSSSSSFIINRDAVTPDQIERLVRYATANPNIVQKYLEDGDERGGCGWFIMIQENHIRGTTHMSDYNLRAWARHLGIPRSAMSFETEHHRGPDLWANYQTSDEFRQMAAQHLEEWIAYTDRGILFCAPTYKALAAQVDAEYGKGSDDEDDTWLPVYLTWIDPEFYGNGEKYENT